MTDKGKYEKFVNEVDLGETSELPPGLVPLMLYNFMEIREATITLEGFMPGLPPSGIEGLDPKTLEIGEVGAGEEGHDWGFPWYFGARYYSAFTPTGEFTTFKSVPMRLPGNLLYFTISLDPDNPDHADMGDVEHWIGEPDEVEQSVMHTTKPRAFFVPAGILGGPMVPRTMPEKPGPVANLVVYDLPFFAGQAAYDRPMSELRPGFDPEELKIQERPSGSKSKYDKYVTEVDVKKIAVPPSHKGKVTPVMYYDGYNNFETTLSIDARLIHGSGIGFGIGESTSDKMYDFDILPHYHAFDEVHCFIGLDPNNRRDLGATVEFWMGEGAEAEKLVFDRPKTIIVEKGTVHYPMYINESHRPFLLMRVIKMPFWAARWINNFPPGFEHEILLDKNFPHC